MSPCMWNGHKTTSNLIARVFNKIHTACSMGSLCYRTALLAAYINEACGKLLLSRLQMKTIRPRMWITRKQERKEEKVVFGSSVCDLNGRYAK